MLKNDWLKMALHNWAHWINSDYAGIIPKKNLSGTLGQFAKPSGRPPLENKQAEAINQSYWLLMSTDVQSAMVINYRYNRGFGDKGLAKIMGYSVSTAKRRVEAAELAIKQLYYSIEQ